MLIKYVKCQNLIDSWKCDHPQFPTKNSSNSVTSNCAFSGKGRDDRALILVYFDSSMIIKFFVEDIYFFSILTIFKR